MLTAYDAPTAELLETAGVDFLLVGDSVGMVLLGYSSTLPVSMDEMIHHAKAVRRGAPRSFVIGDMPYEAVSHGPKRALAAARRFMKEAGCNAVKLEWRPDCLETCRLLVRSRIPVMGHVGLTPQAVKKKDGFRVQGQAADGAFHIFTQARAFERTGAFSVLLECVPWPVARVITRALRIPTIGIGAGPHCDGQVLVFQDLVGLFKKFTPRFVKRYADADALMRRAVSGYIRDVRARKFPNIRKNSFAMAEREQRLFLQKIKESK